MILMKFSNWREIYRIYSSDSFNIARNWLPLAKYRLSQIPTFQHTFIFIISLSLWYDRSIGTPILRDVDFSFWHSRLAAFWRFLTTGVQLACNFISSLYVSCKYCVFTCVYSAPSVCQMYIFCIYFHVSRNQPYRAKSKPFHLRKYVWGKSQLKVLLLPIIA